MADYRFTEYFEKKVLAKRPYLTKELCVRVVEAPIRLSDKKRTDFGFGRAIPELEGKFLRVITLEDNVTIHNAFLARQAVQAMKVNYFPDTDSLYIDG